MSAIRSVAVLLIGLSTAYLGGCGGSSRNAGLVGQPNLANDAVSGGLPRQAHNTEGYDRIYENAFQAVTQHPLSTFSIDVDTASYSNVRRFLQQGQLPPPDAVRIEELINYFPYDYTPPTASTPFAVHVDVADCPWQPEHRLARIALKGKEIAAEERPPCNLVFLIDVSGSMHDPRKLPLLKRAFPMLVQRLTEKDRVAIVVYAGKEGLVLPSTPCSNRSAILAALDRLDAGGSTNGGAGIQLAYAVAQDNFIPGGTNRVILASDGDFNVGITGSDLLRLVEDKRKTGVFLTVLGFGTGNLKDSMMEQLADKGNGQYAYIDTISEARKVFVEQLTGTLFTIAKDVKIQVEFNPSKVQAYRLIGYENRLLRPEDFKDDRKDAGDIGAGHTVTALYELVPPGVKIDLPSIDPLKYQQASTIKGGDEALTVKLRYKEPDRDVSVPLDVPVRDTGAKLAEATPDFRFAAAVAAFGMLLRDSAYKGITTFDQVRELGRGGQGADPHGYRAEFLRLVDEAATAKKR